jgi:hypothetical protein
MLGTCFDFFLIPVVRRRERDFGACSAVKCNILGDYYKAPFDVDCSYFEYRIFEYFFII